MTNVYDIAFFCVFANHLSISINFLCPENCCCSYIYEIIFFSDYMSLPCDRGDAFKEASSSEDTSARLHASGDTRRLLCTNRHKSGDLVVANVSLVSESHVRFFFLSRCRFLADANWPPWWIVCQWAIRRDSWTSMIRWRLLRPMWIIIKSEQQRSDICPVYTQSWVIRFWYQ